ncbi:MAG: glycosyltransferase [Bacteroidales bacterium]
MITASIVAYKTSDKDIQTVLQCACNSSIERLYLIDNSPTDDLRKYASYSPKIEYIYGHGNMGYGAAHNIGIRKSIALNSDYHVVINPDILFETEIAGQLEQFMNNNKTIGFVMPKIVYPSGDVQLLCKLLPTPSDWIFRRFSPFKSQVVKMNEKYELRFTGYDKQMDVPSLSGCFMFLRTSVLEEVKGFDERFFMYAEDVDLCRRIGEVSRTVFYPDLSVIHNYEKGSYKNNKLLMYHIKSAIQYFNKWGWVFDKKRKITNRIVLDRLGFED